MESNIKVSVVKQSTDFKKFAKTKCTSMKEAIDLVKHFGLKNVRLKFKNVNGTIEEWDNL